MDPIEAQKIIESLGLTYLGITTGRHRDVYVWFNDAPGSTRVMRLEDVSVENIQKKLAQ